MIMDIEEKHAAQACSKQESDPTPNLKRFMNEDREKILRQLREWKSYANTDDMRDFVGEIIDELCEGNCVQFVRFCSIALKTE